MLKLYVPIAPPAVTVKGVFDPGVSTEGEIAQVLGGAVAPVPVPATQFMVTLLVYPLTAVAVPLKTAVWAENAVSGELEIAS
jgi:hypothetical protein